LFFTAVFLFFTAGCRHLGNGVIGSATCIGIDPPLSNHNVFNHPRGLAGIHPDATTIGLSRPVNPGKRQAEQE
jgi:hypothetical protein